MLPAHIPLSVAEKILFIGECILVFEHGATRGNGESRPSLASSRSGQVLKKREGEFRGLLRQLAAEPTFSVDKFSTAIETIRNCVSEELWKLVMEADLLGELLNLKAVFLLGRGELFQALIPMLTPFLLTPAGPQANVTGLLHSAGRQVLMEDNVLEKFTLSLKMPPAPNATTSTQTSGVLTEQWHALRLAYNACWPLDKLQTPAAQDRYNAIFSFLLDVRRAQHRLQQLWIIQRRAGGWGEGSCLRWTLRHHMALLIDNIQYYLQASTTESLLFFSMLSIPCQVDVLESQHWQLVRAVKETRDYQKLESAHHTFLASVAAQCFLHSPVVARALHHLLSLVHQFCAHLEASVAHGGTDEKTVEGLHEEFERAAALLFFHLSNLRLHGREQQHTSQLIMRIDYNRYYSHHSGSFQRLTAGTSIET
ncbi:Gamma-tubulin complex component 4 [Chionoecetes opilio]|uniref:Gamma-tubulin complex component n=1 Tax=Chionoecetes opilio TaxID=41210 RepID=A0A8J4YB69_CHIOP|nr:Gamma-tubulin complex component 4 [Chionoecetes opilio]